LLSCDGITFATFIAGAKSFLLSFLQHIYLHCQQWWCKHSSNSLLVITIKFFRVYWILGIHNLKMGSNNIVLDSWCTFIVCFLASLWILKTYGCLKEIWCTSKNYGSLRSFDLQALTLNIYNYKTLRICKAKTSSKFPMSKDQNPSFPKKIHNKLKFNLGFISWFASISRIHFQSSIFPSFCGFEFKVFFFKKKFLQIYYNLIVF
jgi:hypothetical protein